MTDSKNSMSLDDLKKEASAVNESKNETEKQGEQKFHPELWKKFFIIAGVILALIAIFLLVPIPA